MKKLFTLLCCLFVGFTAQAETKEINLTSDNTIVLDQAFTSESVGEVMQAARKLDSKLQSGYPIYLFLYTPGGSIQAGVELIEYLEGLNRPVHTVTLFAASMGFQLVQHMDKRYVTRYAVLMSHKARGSFSGSFGGSISQMDTRYSLWLRRISLMDQKTVDRTGGKQTMDSYINAYSPELWLNGAEAVEQGYADEVVNLKCDDSLNGSKEQKIDLGFIKFTVVLSQCPLQTAPLEVKVDVITNKGLMSLDDFLQNDGQFNCEKEVKPTQIQVQKTSKSLPPFYQYEDDVFNEPKQAPQKEQICLKDTSLKLQDILNKKQEIMKQHTKDPKDNIVYSY